jgi:hypothetical protein
LHLEPKYPSTLTLLAGNIGQFEFPHALHEFIHWQNHPHSDRAEPVDDSFDGPIRVYHMATVQYYAPSSQCGIGGMYREMIRANPNFGGSLRYDTVFVLVSDNDEDMKGLLVARILLFFTYFDAYQGRDTPCALVNWFIHPDNKPQRDEDTGMWKLCRELDEAGNKPVQVIHLDTILHGAHLLPCYGEGFLPENFSYIYALDAFDYYLVNQFIDYHAHELLD